jgi:phospholipid/cholesterol/gamma-HCH transport system permease protein
MFRDLGSILLLFVATVRALSRVWRERRKVLEQFFEIGNASLFMACTLSFFIGGVLALQTGPLLVEQGLGSTLGSIVGMSMIKELAPVMMGILLAGRIGSAMAAELGSMRVYQEIDALKTLNIDPVSYLVLPRVVAITLALPCLVIFSNLVGCFGGALVSNYNREIAVSFGAFFENLRQSVETKHILNGLFKSVIFALTVGVVSCQQGLATLGGPRAIGRTVTKAVVNSLVFILLLDYVLTRLLLPFDR